MSKKKKIIIISIVIFILLLITSIFIYITKIRYKEIKLDQDTFEVDVFENKKISELVPDVTLKEDSIIDTETIGSKKFDIKFIKNNKRYKSTIEVKVVDNIAPTVFTSSSVRIYKGNKVDLINKFIGGDNYDNKPKKEIVGDYDINKVGSYDLTYKITDSSGNVTEKDFVLYVKEKPTTTIKAKSTKQIEKEDDGLEFSSVIEKYKEDNTMIGIDVSKWQGDINFKKVKEAGCEFVIIRLGYQKGLNGEMTLDVKYADNIKKATEQGLKVGLYVYTYAASVEDVSKWQGDINFKKVKEAGCEFVIIRLGYQKGLNGEMTLDVKYADNIKKATEQGLKVGLYVYTYAASVEDAKNQAQWAIKNIGDYDIDLGISYDWESWSNFNKLNLSYHNFTKLADTFLDSVKKYGYTGYLYSSKYYLENIWDEHDHDIWLAHYTSKTNYSGDYKIWQMSNSGRIDGIKGDVDIDILYLK